MKKKAQKKTKVKKKIARRLARPTLKIVRKTRLIKASKLFKKLKIQKYAPTEKEVLNNSPVQNYSSNPRGFELPECYGEDKLVLMVRDPWWLYSYWEVTAGKETETADNMFREGASIEKKVLRVYDVTDKQALEHHTFFDIEIGFAGNWYIDVGQPDRQWMAELGFRARDGRFFMLVRSNIVRTPRFGVSDVLDEEWLLPDELYWKIFGLSGGLLGQKSSLAVREVLERYLKSLGSSENSPGFSPRLVFSPELILEKI